MGPSGCGKSTLLQAMAGIIPQMVPVPIKADQMTTPAHMGYVFQDPDTQFCMSTVGEEIGFSLENLGVPTEEMQPKIEKLLSLVGLESVNTEVEIAHLSGGMKQRLALACVLASDPQVLFLDEPTAMLDPVGTEELWRKVEQLSADKTVIIVEHKIEHVWHWVDRVILFNHQGEIMADQSPDTLFQTQMEQVKQCGIWYPEVWETDRSTPFGQNTPPETLVSLSQLQIGRQDKKLIEAEKLSIHKQDWVIITGENGAGKTSLLYYLMGWLPKAPPLHETDPLKQVLIFQNPENQFVEKMVYKEIYSSVPSDKAEAITKEYLMKFSLWDLRDQHPFQLSMGEKRRLSIAIGLATTSDLILLDEPTLGLDTTQMFVVLDQLRAFQHQGGTIVMVTHEQAMIDKYATQHWHVKAQGIQIQQKGSLYV